MVIIIIIIILVINPQNKMTDSLGTQPMGIGHLRPLINCPDPNLAKKSTH